MDGLPAFRVSPKAKNTRKGLAGGWAFRRIKVKDQERYEEKPDKGALSHPCEACEYALMGAGEGKAALRPAEPQLMHGRAQPPVQVWSSW